MSISLVVMAAGLGSRYGGNKQIEGVGPDNEVLMEYAIYDAIRAGFDKVVFVIKPGMEELMDRLCGYVSGRTAKSGKTVEVAYVFQDFSSVPKFYAIPPQRTKPFGTVHALLCAREEVDGPCCVINADDYYGAEAYRMMYEALLELPAEGRSVMVGYQLNRTASLHGTVSRGVCTMESEKLMGIRETKKIQMYPDGSLRDLVNDCPLAPDSTVSMNFWGFAPSIFTVLETYFENFLRHQAGEDLTAECLLPVMVDHEMKAGTLEVTVLRSADRWFGMTYQEDRAEVAEQLKRLHREGVYPASLRD